MPELPPQARKPAEVLTRLQQLQQQRSDGNVKLRKTQESLERAISILENTLVNMSDKAVQDWLDGGDDFEFE